MIDMRFSPEVEKARRERDPVAILESSVIAHGLPRPENLETARACEAEIRARGVVPATVALHDGAVLIGMTDAQLDAMATTPEVAKVNLSNLPVVLSNRSWGASTVSSSLWAGHLASFAVLITGGIGGVHRDFASTLDISADLAALNRFPLVVVCSGVKSLLDVPATRERLETLGIPLLGWRTDTLPRFYLRESASRVDARVETPEEIAAIARLHWDAGGKGLVVGIPIPPDDEINEATLEQAIAKAEEERLRADPPIEGRAITPYILDRLNQHTEGATLRANIALLRNNARVGAEIALALRPHQLLDGL